MNNYEHVNPNPKNKNVGDCVIRAIAIATDQLWEDVYLDICIKGYIMSDMPSSNNVWSSYLTEKGWKYHYLQNTCPFCYTINDFCNEHKTGTYILATGSHVVCIKEGKYLDAWDSGDKIPMFYFSKE